MAASGSAGRRSRLRCRGRLGRWLRRRAGGAATGGRGVTDAVFTDPLAAADGSGEGLGAGTRGAADGDERSLRRRRRRACRGGRRRRAGGRGDETGAIRRPAGGRSRRGRRPGRRDRSRTTTANTERRGEGRHSPVRSRAADRCPATPVADASRMTRPRLSAGIGASAPRALRRPASVELSPCDGRRAPPSTPDPVRRRSSSMTSGRGGTEDGAGGRRVPGRHGGSPSPRLRARRPARRPAPRASAARPPCRSQRAGTSGTGSDEAAAGSSGRARRPTASRNRGGGGSCSSRFRRLGLGRLDGLLDRRGRPARLPAGRLRLATIPSYRPWQHPRGRARAPAPARDSGIGGVGLGGVRARTLTGAAADHVGSRGLLARSIGLRRRARRTRPRRTRPRRTRSRRRSSSDSLAYAYGYACAGDAPASSSIARRPAPPRTEAPSAAKAGRDPIAGACRSSAPDGAVLGRRAGDRTLEARCAIDPTGPVL